MAEARWAKVLQVVYENEDTGRSRLPEELGLDAGGRGEALEFLARHGLIEGTDAPVLTEKGFEVARQREMQRSQFEMNMFLAAFTFVLSLAIVVQAVSQLLAYGVTGQVAGGGLVVLTVIFLGLLERRTGLLMLLLRGR